MGVSADLLALISGVDFLTVSGQDCGVTLDSATWSSSEYTGIIPTASETTSAPGCMVTLLSLSNLLLSVRIEIGTALGTDVWSTGEELATGGWMTPPELDDNLVRSTIGMVVSKSGLCLGWVQLTEISSGVEPPVLPVLLRLTIVAGALEPREPTVRPRER